MSLTSEMLRIGAQFESAQAARRTAVATIAATVRRDLQKNRSARAHAMATRRRSTREDLNELFGTVAFSRGAARDLIEGFARDREQKCAALQTMLTTSARNLQATVAGRIADLAAQRAAMSRQARTTRRACVTRLQRQVHDLLDNAADFIRGLHQDRAGAERGWEQHCRAVRRLPKSAPRSETMPHKRVAKAKPGIAQTGTEGEAHA